MVDNNIKFPDWNGHPSTPHYYKDEVDAWFKRCIEGFPIYIDEDETAKSLRETVGEHIATDYDFAIPYWFLKWFEQFKDDEQ